MLTALALALGLLATSLPAYAVLRWRLNLATGCSRVEYQVVKRFFSRMPLSAVWYSPRLWGIVIWAVALCLAATSLALLTALVGFAQFGIGHPTVLEPRPLNHTVHAGLAGVVFWSAFGIFLAGAGAYYLRRRRWLAHVLHWWWDPTLPVHATYPDQSEVDVNSLDPCYLATAQRLSIAMVLVGVACTATAIVVAIMTG